jgi:hypothetical protein
VQHQRRLAQPRDDAAGDDIRPPAFQRVERALQGDPLADQRAGIGARDAGIRRAQMAQPAEAEQLLGPFLRRRLDLERRAAVQITTLPAKAKRPE